MSSANVQETIAGQIVGLQVGYSLIPFTILDNHRSITYLTHTYIELILYLVLFQVVDKY